MSDVNQEIAKQLDELAELRSALSIAAADKQAAINQLLSDEQKGKLLEIDAEFDDRVAVATEKASVLEEQIRNSVRAAGVTVKGQYMQAIFSTRTSWDNKRMKEYAEAHPEVRVAMVQTSVVTLKTRES